jgi:hypothetical protein
VYARPTHRRRQCWLLAFALSFVLLSQWLALVHAVVHPLGAAKAGVQEHVNAPAPSIAHKVRELVSGHESGSNVCQLLNQLCQPTPSIDVPAAALPQAVEQQVAAVPLLREERPQWGLYRARAPPVLA